MDAKILAKLRRDQALHALPDGREGIDVTLQFVGAVPAGPRGERREWLTQRFCALQDHLDAHLDLKQESLSVSGQSIEATVPVDEIDVISESLIRDDVRVTVTQTVNVLGDR